MKKDQLIGKIGKMESSKESSKRKTPKSSLATVTIKEIPTVASHIEEHRRLIDAMNETDEQWIESMKAGGVIFQSINLGPATLVIDNMTALQQEMLAKAVKANTPTGGTFSINGGKPLKWNATAKQIDKALKDAYARIKSKRRKNPLP